ncbi:MAG: NUDIX hydrolase [Fidelibacterota bacterium]|nr:MAG: NUDIX hydrolase [Candidatus Neomarinimicrobiota bacterium]
MATEDLREKSISSTSVFQGRLLDVRRDEVELPGGRQAVREYIRHPGAAVMVPMREDGKLIFLRQFRYALDRVMVELPAGKLDPGEEPESTARRELAEETGYTARKLVRLGIIHPCIGYSDEEIVVYLAQGLERLEAEAEADEFVEPFELGLDEALGWIEGGKITDVKTIIALYWAERYLQGEWGK